jgi:hypothetical protein
MLLTSVEYDETGQRLQTNKGGSRELPGIVALVQPLRLSWPACDISHAGVALSEKVDTRKKRIKGQKDC